MSSLDLMKKECFASGTLSSASFKRRFIKKRRVAPWAQQDAGSDCQLCRWDTHKVSIHRVELWLLSRLAPHVQTRPFWSRWYCFLSQLCEYAPKCSFCLISVMTDQDGLSFFHCHTVRVCSVNDLFTETTTFLGWESVLISNVSSRDATDDLFFIIISYYMNLFYGFVA